MRQAIAAHEGTGVVALGLSSTLLVFTDLEASPTLLQIDEEDSKLAASEHGDHASTTDVVAIAFNADGTLLVVGYNDKWLRCWNLETLTCVAKTRLAKKITSVAIAPGPGVCVCVCLRMCLCDHACVCV